MQAQVSQVLRDCGRLRRPLVTSVADVLEDAGRRLQHVLDETLRAAVLLGNLVDAGDDCTRRPAVHDPNVTEEAFEIISQVLLGAVPDRHTMGRDSVWQVSQQRRLEDVVARQWFARSVQHHEHAVGPIDISSRHMHNAAPIEQETPSLIPNRQALPPGIEGYNATLAAAPDRAGFPQ